MGRGGGCPDEKRGPAGRGQEHKAEAASRRVTGSQANREASWAGPSFMHLRRAGLCCSGSHRCNDLKHPYPPHLSPSGVPSSCAFPSMPGEKSTLGSSGR